MNPSAANINTPVPEIRPPFPGGPDMQPHVPTPEDPSLFQRVADSVGDFAVRAYTETATRVSAAKDSLAEKAEKSGGIRGNLVRWGTVAACIGFAAGALYAKSKGVETGGSGAGTQAASDIINTDVMGQTREVKMQLVDYSTTLADAAPSPDPLFDRRGGGTDEQGNGLLELIGKGVIGVGVAAGMCAGIIYYRRRRHRKAENQHNGDQTKTVRNRKEESNRKRMERVYNHVGGELSVDSTGSRPPFTNGEWAQQLSFYPYRPMEKQPKPVRHGWWGRLLRRSDPVPRP